MREMAMRRIVIGVDYGMKEVRNELTMKTRMKFTQSNQDVFLTPDILSQLSSLS